MSRQLRTLHAASSEPFVQPTVASSTALVIPNYGVTDLTTSAAADYVLAPPEKGVTKTLICTSSTSVARVVRGSTAATVTFTLAGATQIGFNSTVDAVVRLLGISSTRWTIVSAYPPSAAVNSTGIVVGTS